MRSLRVFRICPLHNNSEIFRTEQSLDQKPFAEQIALLQQEGILLPGGWASATEAEGFTVFETIYNDTSLQRQWCSEHSPQLLSLARTGVDITFDILKEQVRLFQPDIIFIYAHGLILVPMAARMELRSALNNQVLLTGYWGDELPKEYYQDFRDLDFIFCSSSVYQQRFMEWTGTPAETIGNCFDNVIKVKQSHEKKYDFIFCGRTGYRLAQHVARYNNLVEIASKTDLQIWGYEWPKFSRWPPWTKERLLDLLCDVPTSTLTLFYRLLLQTKTMLGEGWLLHKARRAIELTLDRKGKCARGLPQNDSERAQSYWQREYWYDKKPLQTLFPKRFKPLLVNGSDYYALLVDSRLVLNLHRVEDADIGNVRCFEVTGLGSCLVTDRGPELKEFFDVENDIVTFQTAQECVEKVNYLLAHPNEIDRIAKNGQRTTLSRHTVKHRAKAIAHKHRELWAAKPARFRADPLPAAVVHAIYDADKNPISYDVAFFLQAAEIFRKLSGAADLVISIVWPADISDIPGLPKRYNLAVGADAKAFRIFHILAQMAELTTNKTVSQIKSRKYIDASLEFLRGKKVITFPHLDNTHHSIYYRLVNENPDLMEGFSASRAAHRYVGQWLQTFTGPSKILCITLRQYEFDPVRNSNMAAWEEFLGRINPTEFTIVIVPDTDHFADPKSPFGGKYHVFTPACFDVDLRFALYETAYLNMFVNNGPGSAATLSRKIKYLMFKLVVPGVTHCSEEVLLQLGFEPGKSPSYANEFQKWVWMDDSAEILWSEFCAMRKKIDSGCNTPDTFGLLSDDE
jgi:spore maturation protein CgeB